MCFLRARNESSGPPRVNSALLARRESGLARSRRDYVISAKSLSDWLAEGSLGRRPAGRTRPTDVPPRPYSERAARWPAGCERASKASRCRCQGDAVTDLGGWPQRRLPQLAGRQVVDGSWGLRTQKRGHGVHLRPREISRGGTNDAVITLIITLRVECRDVALFVLEE